MRVLMLTMCVYFSGVVGCKPAVRESASDYEVKIIPPSVLNKLIKRFENVDEALSHSVHAFQGVRWNSTLGYSGFEDIDDSILRSTKLFDILIERGASPNMGLLKVAGYSDSDSHELLKLFISREATNFNEALTKVDSVDNAKVLIEAGATNLDEALYLRHAAQNYVEVSEYLISKGASPDKAIVVGIQHPIGNNNMLHTVQFLFKRGANDFNGALKAINDKRINIKAGRYDSYYKKYGDVDDIKWHQLHQLNETESFIKEARGNN